MSRAPAPLFPEDSTPADVSPARPLLLAADEYGQETGIREYLQIVLRFKWSILGLMIAGAATGWYYAGTLTPLYQAEVRLLVEFNQPSLTTVRDFEALPSHWLFFQTQADIIRSRAVAERVVDRLQLGFGKRPSATAAPAPSSWFANLRGALADWMPEEWRSKPAAPATPQQTRSAFVNMVQGGVSVDGGKESEVLTVGFVDTDATRAARVANAVAEAYIGFGLDSRVRNVSEATDWLGGRLEELRAKLDESEQALREFQSREGMIDTQSREQLVGARIGSLTTELIKAQTRRSGAQARFAEVRKLADNPRKLDTLVSVLDSQLVLEAYRQRAGLRRKISELSERYGEKHPKMIAARADLKQTEGRLRAEIDKAVSSARKALQVAQAQEREIKNTIERQKTDMRQLSGKASQLAQLERDVQANRELYDSVLTRFKEADISQKNDVSNVRVIDRAEAPLAPFAPDKDRILALGAAIGLLLGIILALLRHFFDNTFKSRDDVEQHLHLPVIGSLGSVKAARKTGGPERYLLHEPRSAFSEGVHDIRTALLLSRVDQPRRVILVTSAVPGEGKTTLAANLAISFGQRGRTLLLDADLRKGRVADVASRPHEQGLADLVSGDCEAREVVIPDAQAAGLHVLTAGSTAPNPLEVLSSERFARVLDGLRKSFEYIVVDGSPVLPVSDSIVLSHLVDNVLFVVQAEHTTHNMASDALKRLMSAHVQPVGVVLQQMNLRAINRYGRGYDRMYNGYYRYTRG